MAGKKSYSCPPPRAAPVPPVMPIMPMQLLCVICHMPGAGPGGLCAACAGGVTGQIAAKHCPQCAAVYHTNDAVCPACVAKMMTQMQAMTAMRAAQAIVGTTTMTPPKPVPLPRADMQVVDLVGWRVWRITSLGYLRSLTADSIWLPGEPMEAPLVVDSHQQATKPAEYGVHVFKERKGAVLKLENYPTAHSGAASFAVGSVLLWGDVVEHERGYRAERAKILSIDDVTWKGKPPWDKETAEVLGFLRRRYGVDRPVDSGPTAIDEGAAP